MHFNAVIAQGLDYGVQSLAGQGNVAQVVVAFDFPGHVMRAGAIGLSETEMYRTETLVVVAVAERLSAAVMAQLSAYLCENFVGKIEQLKASAACLVRHGVW